MIVSKTPLRISFFSGGSDLPSFYEQDFGAALSVTIDKFNYVIVNKTDNNTFQFTYDFIDEVSHIDDMNHKIVREVLKYYNISKNISINSISDISVRGSGLGSSSAFTVGLLNTLLTEATPKQLAEAAFMIEHEKCGYACGKQDQMAASIGGFNYFTFRKEGSTVRQLNNNHIIWGENRLQELEKHLLLLNTKVKRKTDNFLKTQSSVMNDIVKFDLVKKSRDKAWDAIRILENRFIPLSEFGSLLHESWLDKQNVTNDISNSEINDIYTKARIEGAIGGKLLGAGGGGYMLLFVLPEDRQNVIDSLNLPVINFKFYYEGSKVTTI